MIQFEINKMICYLSIQWDGAQVSKQKIQRILLHFSFSDSGLLIIKELIDLIQPAIVIQLRSSNPYFRHTMPEINQQWSANGPISTIYRQMNQIPLNFSYLNYEYRLLLTDISQHSHGKSNLTRQACLWSYFSQLEKTNTILRPLIDYIDHIEIFKFQKIGIGLMHRQIEAKYLFEVLNGSMVGLCQVENDMVRIDLKTLNLSYWAMTKFL